MQLSQLRAFATVVDQDGFSSAAHALGRTQSAISHAIAALEKELGAPLLHRGREGIHPTALGAQILPRVRAALRQIEAITEDTRSLRDLNQGRLRIAAFPTACQLLPPYIAALRRAHPGIDVTLWEGTDQEVERWITDNLIDLGIRASLTQPDAGELVLTSDEMVAVVDQDHPLANEIAIELADLADDPLLVSDGGCEPLLADLHNQAGLPLRVDQRIREMSTLLAMVREGLGVTIVPELSTTGAHGVVTLPLRPRPQRHLTVISPSDPPSLPALALHNLISAQAGEAAAD